jgi:hypothetical protein
LIFVLRISFLVLTPALLFISFELKGACHCALHLMKATEFEQEY